MNKDNYLNELERLLQLKKINNMYSILRDYSTKIEDLTKANLTFDEIVSELGTPESIIKELVKGKNQKDDFEDDKTSEVILDDNTEEKIIDVEVEEHEEAIEDQADNEDFDNDPEVFENETNQKNNQFQDSFLDQHLKNKQDYKKATEDTKSTKDTKTYDNQFKDGWYKNSNNNNTILYVIIAILAVIGITRLISKTSSFAYFSGFHIFSYGISIFGTIVVIAILVAIIKKSNNKK